MNNSSKEDFRPQYAAFLKSPAGQDLLKHAEVLEKAFILQGIKAETNDGKANSLSKLEGLIALRDYMLRMSKKG